MGYYVGSVFFHPGLEGTRGMTEREPSIRVLIAALEAI